MGNYTLGKLVGKGSFGKVYLATHKLTNGTKASIGTCITPCSYTPTRVAVIRIWRLVTGVLKCFMGAAYRWC